MKLNENVKRVLLCSLWDLATCSKDVMPNVVPVTFKGIMDDGTPTVGDVFLETPLSPGAVRSRAQRSMSLRGRSSMNTGRWSRRCSMARPQRRAR